MIKSKIKKIIEKSLKELREEKVIPEDNILEFKIEHPKEKDHGDFSTNLALVLARKIGEKPENLAEILVKKFKKFGLEIFKKIEIAKPAFINFFLTDRILIEELKKILKDKKIYGKKQIGKTLVIDYSSPNVAKKFGIGHLRSTIIGQAIYNIYKFLNWKVIGDNHLGDWGTQFAELIFQIKNKKLDPQKLTVEEMENLYIQFHKEAEKNPDLIEEGKKWFEKLEQGDREARKIWKICLKKSLKEYDKIYKTLGVKIDYSLGESFYLPMVKEIVEEAKRKKFAKKSQGALIFQFPQNQLPPAILLKSDGTTTYFLRDLATAKYRIKRWNPDLIVYEVGSEQTLHLKQLFLAVTFFGWSKKVKFFHIAHGLYRTKTGKFSTRKGETVHLEDILNEAIERAKEILAKSKNIKRLSKSEKEKIAKIIGIGAIKYNDLVEHYSKDIIFDWDKILNLKGNSAPYLQYTFVRCQSVLRKAKIRISHLKLKILNLREEERDILKQIYKFPEVIVEAAEKFSPHLICNFLFELAQKYNSFYETYPIIKAENEEIKHFRLALTFAIGQILKKGLNLLGVLTPEKM